MQSARDGIGRAANLAISGAIEMRASTYPLLDLESPIAGFSLVEELGCGAFARVFLARERELADRPVALKVTRRGSREPQTLARLQHTHIVPVHSHRIDKATGLHLLCMPFFGRTTLAQVLADSRAQGTRSGAGLVESLDRLEPARGLGKREPALAAQARDDHFSHELAVIDDQDLQGDPPVPAVLDTEHTWSRGIWN